MERQVEEESRGLMGPEQQNIIDSYIQRVDTEESPVKKLRQSNV